MYYIHNNVNFLKAEKYKALNLKISNSQKSSYISLCINDLKQAKTADFKKIFFNVYFYF